MSLFSFVLVGHSMQHKFNVKMDCGGCSKAVNAVLTKTPGVESVKIDMGAQTVTVVGSASQQTILEQIKKTGFREFLSISP